MIRRRVVWVTLGIIGLALASCSFNSNPHRPPTIPVVEVDFNELNEGTISTARIAHESESFEFDGLIEIDRSVDTMAIRGRYLSRQPLQPGARLAIQTYSPRGDLRVRGLPRTEFQEGETSDRSAHFDYVFSFKNWGLEGGESTLLVQFNYVQEGRFWYDVEYPEIELPSILIKGINSFETIDLAWGAIPRILPRDSVATLPVLYRARKSHDSDFNHARSLESFREETRIENPRAPLNSGISLMGDWILAFNRCLFDSSGRFEARHGFVWDGVQWYGSNSVNDYKTIWVMPAAIYLTALAFYFGALVYSWKIVSKIEKRVSRLAGRGSLIVAGAIVLLWASTNSLVFVVLLAIVGYWLATRSWDRSIRIFAIAASLLICMELYWGWLFVRHVVTPWGLVLSMGLYVIVLLPLTYFRRPAVLVVGFTFFLLACMSNYLLLDLYYLFFQDFPTLKALGYTSQVSSLTDSIGALWSDRHTIALLIAIWYWGCFLFCFGSVPRGASPKIESSAASVP